MFDRFDVRAARDAAERDTLLLALAETHGIVEHACQLMRVSRATAYAMIRKHGLTLERMVVARVPATPEPPESEANDG